MNDKIVPLTAAACLIALTVVLKNILLVPAETLSKDIIIYIIIYMGFIITYPLAKEESGKPKYTLLWVLIIILVTLAIIAVYAI
jgi:hypothetical protein